MQKSAILWYFQKLSQGETSFLDHPFQSRNPYSTSLIFGPLTEYKCKSDNKKIVYYIITIYTINQYYVGEMEVLQWYLITQLEENWNFIYLPTFASHSSHSSHLLSGLSRPNFLSTVSGKNLTGVLWVANESLFTKFNVLWLVCGTTTQNSPPSGVSGDSKRGPLQHQFLGVRMH